MPTPESDGAQAPPKDTPATPGRATKHQAPEPPAQGQAQGDAEQAPTPPIDEQEQHHGPVWSASEAARRCGIGRATMTRKLQADEIAGATRDEDGHWRIPLSGLLAAGLRPDRPAPAEDRSPQDHSEDTSDVDHVAAAVELAELRGQLAVERARREAAEQLANERAARIDDLRHALRAIEPPTAPAQEEKPHVTAPTEADPQAVSSPQPMSLADRLHRWLRG